MFHKLKQNTDVLIKLLNERKKLLLKLIDSTKQAEGCNTEGYLKVLTKPHRVEYYHVTDKTRRYIKRSEHQLAVLLAQKSYDEKILAKATQELKILEKVTPFQYQNLYSNLCPERQKLITPIYVDDEKFIRDWKNVQYDSLSVDNLTSEFYTVRGERVRSKSELIIADTLERRGIPYRYEYPVILKGIGTVHPDFYCLNTRTREEICWEHFGMMDDPEYAQNAIVKINAYSKSGYIQGKNFVYTMESSQSPISSRIVEKIIDVNLA